MPWYMTQYPPLPTQSHPPNDKTEGVVIGFYGSCVWARKRREAEDMIVARNIGEAIVFVLGTKKRPEPTASEMFRKRTMTKRQALQAIHGVTFLAYLAMRSLATPPQDVVGDTGFLHEALHSLLSGEPRRAELIATLQFYERRVPGYLNMRRQDAG
jgi:hypothetical protein